MRPYINLRKSNGSHANQALRRLADRLDNVGECSRDQVTPLDADLLIQWGFKPTKSLMSAIDRGIPYIIFDLGYFDGGRMGRFSMSYNGFHGTALDVPDVLDRAPRPHPEILDWQEGGRRVIVAGQMPLDQSLRGQDIESWMGRAATEASEVFKLPVHKRVHPKMLNPWEPPPPPLIQDLLDCACLVTWTSTAAVQALVQGVPVVAQHPGSMAFPIASYSMKVRTPPGREGWAHKLSWREWDFNSVTDLKLLAKTITEMYPYAETMPLDSPRNVL